MFAWQLYMKDWEKNLDNNLYEIMDKLKIKDVDKMMEIVNTLKDYGVITD